MSTLVTTEATVQILNSFILSIFLIICGTRNATIADGTRLHA